MRISLVCSSRIRVQKKHTQIEKDWNMNENEFENQLTRRVFIKRTSGTALAFGVASMYSPMEALATGDGIEDATPYLLGGYLILKLL